MDDVKEYIPGVVLVREEDLTPVGNMQVKVVVTGENSEANDDNLPLSQLQYKVLLSVEEACRLFGLGQNCLRDALRNPKCPFAIKVGGKKQLVVRKKLEDYIMEHRYF